jgi:hypothetical protein
MKDQLSCGRRSINVFGDALEGNVLLCERRDGFNQVLERSAEPVQPPDNERVPFS